MTGRGITLCLSGGGYRAALYHLGALRRLDERRLLPQVDTLVAVSGGSILAARLAHVVQRAAPWPDLGERWAGFDAFAADVHEKVSRAMELLPLPGAMRAGALLKWVLPGVGKVVGDMRLADLPARPDVRFTATDLTLAEPFTFARTRIGAPSLGWSGEHGHVPVAEAVWASACFPVAFKSVPARMDADRFHGGTARLHGTHETLLADGGVLDNRALSTLDPDAFVLVSDGGKGASTRASLDHRPAPGLELDDWSIPARVFRSPLYLDGDGVAQRVRAVHGTRAGDHALQRLLEAWRVGGRRGALWSIGDGRHGATAGNAPELYPDEVAARAAAVRTALDAFDADERAVLENQGYLTAEAGMRHFAPDLPGGEAPLQAPWPDLMPEARALQALRSSANPAQGLRRLRKLLG